LLERKSCTHGARLWAGHLIVGGLAAAALALWLGMSSGIADKLEFQGELSYEAFEAAAARGASVRIERSPGGTGAAAMMLGRVKGLVIDGRCDSACAWAFVRNPTACFTRRATFGFHGAHDPGTGRRMLVATKYWLGTVRAPLRARLDGLRTSSRVIYLGFDDMRRYYPDRVCGARPSGTEAPAVVILPVQKPLRDFAQARDAMVVLPVKKSRSDPRREAGG
jgi:hypothetical protein